MFNTFTDTFIDSLQSSKKTLVNTFVKNEELVKTFNEFIDAETAYTKSVISTGVRFGTISSSNQFLDELTSQFKNLIPTSFTSDTKKVA